MNHLGGRVDVGWGGGGWDDESGKRVGVVWVREIRWGRG